MKETTSAVDPSTRSSLPGQPLLGFFGHHRSGSTWISLLLTAVARELDMPHLHAHGPWDFGDDLPRAVEDTGLGIVTYVNAHYSYLDTLPFRGVHVVRDPRDLLVSAYYAHRSSHPTDGWPELVEFRAVLQEVPRDVGLLLEMDFCEGVFEDMRSWPATVPGVLQLKFEEIISDERASFERICRHMGLESRLGSETLDRIVAQHSFKVLSGGRDKGQEDSKEFYRKGAAGDWTEAFSVAHRWAFKNRYQDVLLQYGYEGDDSWSR